MYWADELAIKLKERNLPLEWVDDMKTPSGRIHVGALRGVVVHDLIYRALQDAGLKSNYTYVFENHDPMDDIPSYLPREKFEQYLGMPLFAIPSPEDGYTNYAEFYAEEFKKVFNTIGSHPEIIWTKDLYTSGKMNVGIKIVLDNTPTVKEIFKEMYKKDMPADWFPFQVYCEKCGKVSTTRVYAWDGTVVSYRCLENAVPWTKGCGWEGKTSPFSDEKGMKGKLPWKIEWPVKWQAIGVTVEGAGKDHMSAGGSHDFAKLVCEKVINYHVPYPIPYEWLLIGGRKMSSSKGVGTSAKDVLTILPPELVRFLMVKSKINQQINFDPAEGDTIPKLFDEYQKAADAYFNKTDADLARIFELSQVNEVKRPPGLRFSILAQWVQMPNMEQVIKKDGLEEWANYAKNWVENYAPESEKFLVQKELPSATSSLSQEQKNYLHEVANALDKEQTAESLQIAIYELAKGMSIQPKDAFSAIYIALLGKNHGPRAAWIIHSLDKTFVQERFREI
jgi:lysyl-tRNA synthetase, class I